MSKHNNKTTVKYSSPDEAPIVYEDEVMKKENTEVQEVEEKTEINDTTVNEITPSEETVVNDSKDEEIKEEPKIETPKEKSKKVETVKPKKEIDASNDGITESVLRNFVRVRILGKSNLAGLKMMTPIKACNMIVSNNGTYTVITSPLTAKTLELIIRNHTHLLCLPDLSEERKNSILAKFKNDLNRFKF